jgi:hypothetical protein
MIGNHGERPEFKLGRGIYEGRCVARLSCSHLSLSHARNRVQKNLSASRFLDPNSAVKLSNKFKVFGMA